MSIEVLDPTHESEVSAFEMPARPTSLHGATVGFISNGKEGTKGFFRHLSRILEGEMAWPRRSAHEAQLQRTCTGGDRCRGYGLGSRRIGTR